MLGDVLSQKVRILRARKLDAEAIFAHSHDPALGLAQPY